MKGGVCERAVCAWSARVKTGSSEGELGRQARRTSGCRRVIGGLGWDGVAEESCRSHLAPERQLPKAESRMLCTGSGGSGVERWRGGG
eukprot:3313051-Rhodomonas_salina.1